MVLRVTAPWTSSETFIMRMMIIMIMIMMRGVVKVLIMMMKRLMVVFWPNEHGYMDMDITRKVTWGFALLRHAT